MNPAATATMKPVQAPAVLEGKVIAVTGGGGAIGSEVARLSAQCGARVVVNDVGSQLDGRGADAAPAQRVVDAIRAKGGEAIVSHDSVSTATGAARIVEAALDHYGRIDGVVNNAGIARNCIFHKMSIDDWESVLQVHLHGGFYVSRAAAPHLRKQRSGAFVHMTSTGGLIGNVGQVNYMAAKVGLAALSKGIALDMARFNVRSNCVAPLAKSRLTELIAAGGEAEAARLASFEKMPAAQVAPLVVYLLSDLAHEVNGQIFASRGGELMLMSQYRPARSVHRDGGWTVQSMAAHAMPALRPAFMPLDTSGGLFTWDPI